MNSTPLVSVIIPTFNRAAEVSTAIESVLRQTYAHTEVIVVDDGSTDNTPDVLRHFGERIKVVSQANAGPAAARNRGIRNATGAIVSFLDSDDLWAPTKLERQVRLLAHAGGSVSCCVCNTRLQFSSREAGTSFDLAQIEADPEEGIWTNPLDVLSSRFLLFNQAVAIPREVLKKVGGFEESYFYMEDYDLALRLALAGPFAYIREPLVVWNQGTDGSLRERAGVDEIRCCEMTLQIRRNIVKRAAENRCPARTLRHLSREMNRTRRILRTMQLMHHTAPLVRTAGKITRRVESIRARLFSRSPWYPQMQTVAPKLPKLDVLETSDLLVKPASR